MNATSGPTDVPRTIYHYTSQAGLLGIIHDKALWVSSIRHLNDSAELSYAISMLKGGLDSPWPDFDVDDSADPLTELWVMFREGVLKQLEVLENSDSHVGSFSQERDQLSQWRAYTSGEVGFSIGFNLGMLKSFAEAQHFELLRCTYETSEHRILVSQLLNEAQKMLDKKGEHGVDEAVIRCVRDFMRFAPRFKHPSFKEEKEWRLFKTVEMEEPAKFRIGKSMLVPYGEFDFEDEYNNTPVVEIVIGPTPHMALSKASVERLLVTSDMGHVAVIESSVPFRNW